jgi:hypothetical protein
MFSSVVVVTAILMLAVGNGFATTTAQIVPVAWTDELGDDARPGPLHYVALGDSFSSGEGAPFVDPGKVDAWSRSGSTSSACWCRRPAGMRA